MKNMCWAGAPFLLKKNKNKASIHSWKLWIQNFSGSVVHEIFFNLVRYTVHLRASENSSLHTVVGKNNLDIYKVRQTEETINSSFQQFEPGNNFAFQCKEKRVAFLFLGGPLMESQTFRPLREGGKSALFVNNAGMQNLKS